MQKIQIAEAKRYLIELAERRLEGAKEYRSRKARELYSAEADVTQAYADLDAAHAGVDFRCMIPKSQEGPRNAKNSDR